MKVKLNNVRCAFLQVFEPKAFGAASEGSKPDLAYSSSFIFSKNHPAFKLVNDAIETVAKEKWEAKAPEVLKQLRTADKICLHDGDTKPDHDGFAGNYFIAARNKARPLVLDRDKSPLTQADGRPYAGCYVTAMVDIWAQQNSYGKRINATLSGVQFFKDGDAFTGSAPATPDDFESLADGADAGDVI